MRLDLREAERESRLAELSLVGFVGDHVGDCAFPHRPGERRLKLALPFGVVRRRHVENRLIRLHHIAPVVRRDRGEEARPGVGIADIGAGLRQRIGRLGEGRGIALVHEMQILRRAEEDAAQDEVRAFVRVSNAVSHRQRAAPAAAEDVHPAADAERVAQPIDVLDQVRGRVVGQRRGRAVGGDRRAALPAAALIEQDHAVARRVEIARHYGAARAAGPAVQHDDGFARRVAIFLPVKVMVRRMGHLQQPLASRVRRGIAPFIANLAAVLKRGEIHGHILSKSPVMADRRNGSGPRRVCA